MSAVTLPDGLVLRTAGPADLDQIGALLTGRGEAADALDHRLVVTDPDAGWDGCAVVVDGDRVVSTLTLLDERVRVRCGDTAVVVPAGQVELVATDRAYEGRGLVRALMDWAHRRGNGRGHLVQVMIGIPYFYRQFGYSYAVPIPPTRTLVGRPVSQPGDTVRPATEADVPALAALQDLVQDGVEVALPHPTERWRWLLAREGTRQWVVERDGAVVGSGRATPPDEGVRLAELAGDAAAVHALLVHAVTVAGDEPVQVTTREGVPGLDGLLDTEPARPESYYVRVPDPVALLDALRPVLGARLRAAGLGGATGEAVLSFFRSHVRFPFADGEVGAPGRGGPLQAPGAVGGAGVAPDLVPPLLFGPLGFAGLAAAHPDVYAASAAADLFAALFPPVHADLLMYYLP